MSSSKTLKNRVLVGMSGGVDSSVAAYLLKEQGHEVSGVFMQNWEEETSGPCQASIDADDAQAVCDRLQIELRRINFATEYWQRVFMHFLSEYRSGRTPNPDILCNKEIKFAAFLNYAKQRGADFIATGHYARIKLHNGKHWLLKGLDPAKDQSYFLYALNQAQLTHASFPLGHLNKSAVRTLAKNLGFKNYAKKDSTGICFIGERRFKTFLSDYLPAKPGDIITPCGDIIGRHDGLMFYTLGQRQGLNIGGKKGKPALPWYVAKKDIDANRLIVVQGEHPLLYSDSLLAKNVHFIADPLKLPYSCTAKTRYRQEDKPCTILAVDQDHIKVRFNTRERAVTPGQSIVFYQGETCLGGAVIL